ncbi:MAG: hypothetical protein JSW47_12515 [Phycisphaerales bacterium]|nr:MAG: hypothetical protein JSW47_12515 [Phycisphaerales bacterium]
MKSIAYNSKTSGVMIAATMLAVLALSLAGCGSYNTGIQILPMGNQDVLYLTAADVVQVMRAAGFSDMQIYEHGTALRDGIAQRGAVQVKIDDTVEAVFAAKDDAVYISTRSRGHFIYNVKTGWPDARAR